MFYSIFCIITEEKNIVLGVYAANIHYSTLSLFLIGLCQDKVCWPSAQFVPQKHRISGA